MAYKDEWDREISRNLETKCYFVEEQIGEGAFSKVYRVRRRRDHKILACKVSGDQIQWKRESCLLWRLKASGHPMFPEIYDSWQEKGVCYLVMEYIPGTGLDRLMRQQGRLSQKQAVAIGRKLAEGLVFLEEREGMLYRDLKPENIMLHTDGRIKLLDFGCVCSVRRREEDGMSLGAGRAGTPGYAAPEQFAEEAAVGAYSDVYAFGRLLHFLVTGDNPCMPPACKPPIRSYDHRLGRRLEILLEECVREDCLERLPDMRCVLRRLEKLAQPGTWSYVLQEGCTLLGRRKTAFLYEKNIIRTGL